MVPSVRRPVLMPAASSSSRLKPGKRSTACRFRFSRSCSPKTDSETGPSMAAASRLALAAGRRERRAASRRGRRGPPARRWRCRSRRRLPRSRPHPCALPSPALPGSGSTVGGGSPPSQPSLGLPCCSPQCNAGARYARDGDACSRARPGGRHAAGGMRHDGGMTDLRARLADARLYLCTDSRRETGDLVPFLDAVLAGGVDIVQLREKGLEAGEERALLEVFGAACARHGALLAVNDRADVALAAGADVLHLGQDDLPGPVARRVLVPEPVSGRSQR